MDGEGGAAEQRLHGRLPLCLALWLPCHCRHVSLSSEGSRGHPSAGVAICAETSNP
jgi:hypothetical protein